MPRSIMYADKDNFSFTLDDDRMVDMNNGELSIGNSLYEENEEDATYPLSRALAEMMQRELEREP